MRLLLQQPAEGREAPRFVQLMLQPDLLGGWTLVRESGQIGGRSQVRREQFLDQTSAVGALDEVVPLIGLQAKLARVSLEVEDLDIDAPIAVAPGDLKFALLALALPMIDMLKAAPGPEDPPPLRLSAAHERAVRIRLQSREDALADPRARRVARRFLEAGGGRVETKRAQSSIYIVLPRVTGA